MPSMSRARYMATWRGTVRRLVRAFEAAFGGNLDAALGVRHGFFASVDGAPAEGYRAERAPGAAYGHAPRGDAAPITVVTGAGGRGD